MFSTAPKLYHFVGDKQEAIFTDPGARSMKLCTWHFILRTPQCASPQLFGKQTYNFLWNLWLCTRFELWMRSVIIIIIYSGEKSWTEIDMHRPYFKFFSCCFYFLLISLPDLLYFVNNFPALNNCIVKNII